MVYPLPVVYHSQSLSWVMQTKKHTLLKLENQKLIKPGKPFPLLSKEGCLKGGVVQLKTYHLKQIFPIAQSPTLRGGFRRGQNIQPKLKTVN
jgi:hypothetical protein